jgi:hypothetical protein
VVLEAEGDDFYLSFGDLNPAAVNTTKVSVSLPLSSTPVGAWAVPLDFLTVGIATY